MSAFEIDILKSLEGIRTPLLNKIFEIITAIGEHAVLVVIIAVIYFMIDKGFAKKLLFVTMISLGINGIVKNFVRAPRPFASGKVSCVRPETATGYSFPSGHTQNFSTWSTTLALKGKKLIYAFLSAVGIFAVAFSRMYLGAHFPSDVIAGAVIGISLSLIFSTVYDKVKDKNVLYLAAVLAMTPFAIFFLIDADAHFEDFYKFYGMLCGIPAASMFEEKYVNLNSHVPFSKRLVRVVAGVLFALAIKELFDLMAFSSTRISLLSESVKYFILIFAVMGFYPWVINKLKI